MKDTLKVGLEHVHKYRVPENKTVPFLYPEAPAFQEMPKVFATGFMVGLFEWACIEAMAPHLDPGEGSVGTLVNVTHTAATPPGMEVSVHVRCVGVDGRRAAAGLRRGRPAPGRPGALGLRRPRWTVKRACPWAARG